MWKFRGMVLPGDVYLGVDSVLGIKTIGLDEILKGGSVEKGVKRSRD